MRQWTAEDLRWSTLRRQFPSPLDGSAPSDQAAVLDLVARISPIQSQVPRAPFLTLATRLPGVRYADVVALFEDHRLVKASTLRGTVFTSDRQQYVWAEAIARSGRAPHLAGLVKLPVEDVERLLSAVHERADDWVPWDDLIEHARTLMQESRPEVAAREDQVRMLLWGLAGLLRRPADSAWHKRTDVLRRSARTALPELSESSLDEAVPALVERHLAAYGPVTKDDLCFFLGTRRTPVNRALALLEDRVITGRGPGDEPMVDLADATSARAGEPEAARGVRLLAEFDGCLLGYAGPGRLRFLTPEQLVTVFNPKNAVCAPMVLADGRIVARWRTVGTGRRVRVDVTMLPPHPPLTETALVPAVQAVETALDLEVREIRVA